MGNRAVIALEDKHDAPAIYLHWNGGEDSVCAFIEAARRLDVRTPEDDPPYFLARLGQIIANFFGGTISIGYGRRGELDDSDNGLYVIESFETIYHDGKKLDVRKIAEKSEEGVQKLVDLHKKIDEINK